VPDRMYALMPEALQIKNIPHSSSKKPACWNNLPLNWKVRYWR